jgi:hypothetical protein
MTALTAPISGERVMAFSRGAVERAMKVQEVILRAIDGKLTWAQAADILGYSPRTSWDG